VGLLYIIMYNSRVANTINSYIIKLNIRKFYVLIESTFLLIYSSQKKDDYFPK